MIISLIRNYFPLSDNYHCTLLIRSKEGSNRFRDAFDWSFLEVEYYYLPISERTYDYNEELNVLLSNILKRDYVYYITFLEHTALNYYITGQLSKRGVKICLAPEGTRPYITINKFALFSRLRFTFENYYFLSRQRLKWNSFQINSNKHGFLKENSEIWVEHPRSYPNLNGRSVRQIELFKNVDEVEAARNFFGFSLEAQIPAVDNVIFYVNHWFVVPELYNYEINLLGQIQILFPDRTILIKLHPNTPKHQVESFRKLSNVYISDSTLPAELYILSLNRSTIISFWSAALFMNNESNNYFWMHKLLRIENPSMRWWDITNPTKHIVEIESLKELF